MARWPFGFRHKSLTGLFGEAQDSGYLGEKYDTSKNQIRRWGFGEA